MIFKVISTCFKANKFSLDEAKNTDRKSSVKSTGQDARNSAHLDADVEQMVMNDEQQSEENEIQLEIKEIHNPQSITSRQMMLNERKANVKAKKYYQNTTQSNYELQGKDKQEESVDMMMYKKKVVEEELALLKAKSKLSKWISLF